MYRIWEIKRNDVTIIGDCRRNNLVIVLKLELKRELAEEFGLDMFISFVFVVEWRSKGQRKLTEKCAIK